MAIWRRLRQARRSPKRGNTYRHVSDANDKALRDRGFPVDGKHTPDCHSTGLDGSDGPNSLGAPDFVLKPNMVLSYHPGTVLENDRGFLISDNFLVTSEGAFRLSPHHATAITCSWTPKSQTPPLSHWSSRGLAASRKEGFHCAGQG